MFDFFIHFQGVVDAQSVKRTNFCFYVFLQQKKNMADMVLMAKKPIWLTW